MNATVRKFTLRVLSPVHIGCDEVCEPMSFVVDEESDQLVVFDPVDFFTSLEEPDRKKFSEICRRGTVQSILQVYKFLRARPAQGRAVALCAGFFEHYKQTLDIPLSDVTRISSELNQFAISRTSFLPYDQRPYIPGSALKGAIRTAYLNSVAADKDIRDERTHQELEKRLLNCTGIPDDPFRLLKISDFMPVGEVKTKIVYAVNEKKTPSKHEAGGPYQVLEVIEPDAEFFGSIRLEKPERGVPIKSPLKMEAVLKSLNAFFTKEKRREDDQLSGIGVSVQERQPLNGSNLVRIGRHSGAECVTVEGNRSIRIMQPGSRQAKWSDEATTLWLAAESRKPGNKTGLRPFGWVALDPLEQDREREFIARELDWKTEHERRERIRLDELRQKQEEAEEARRRLEQEAERARLEEERRKQEEAKRAAQLASMPEEERIAARITTEDLSENEVVAIYQRIDEFRNKEVVAAALKEYWIKIGKWEKKDCSNKQLKKVSKIKQILGE